MKGQIRRRAVVLSGAATTPTIAPLLPTANLLYLFDPGKGVYSDAVGTVKAVDGGGVYIWNDQSANANHLTRSGAGLLWHKAGLGTKPSIEFASNQYLSRNVAASIVGSLNVFTIYVVLKTTSTSASSTLVGEGNSGNANPASWTLINETAAGRVGHYHRNTAGSQTANPNSASGSANDGNVHLLTIRRTAINGWSVRLDGTEVATNTTSVDALAIDRFALGALVRNTVASFYTGHLGVVAAYGADNVLSVEPIIANFYAVANYPTTLDDTFIYSSSIDAIANLKAQVTVPVNRSNLPLLVCMHQFSDTAATVISSTFVAATRARFAARGVFCLFPELRGRDSISGSPDAGGREIQDIIDAVNAAISRYGSLIDSTQIHIMGYSGGGGNTLSCLSKFPDFFQSGTSFFGISDYGHDGTNGWWQTTAAYRTTLNAWVGDTPANVPNNYWARDSYLAIANFTGPKVWLFHDHDDTNVPPINSQNVNTALAANANCTYSESKSGDTYRWSHNTPDANTDLQQAEPTFFNPIVAKSYTAWTVPAAGTLKVAGYLDTKRFRLMLGTGIEEFGQVVYDVTARTFTITSDTGAATYSLALKGQAPNTAITSNINGSDVTETSSAAGVVTYTGNV